MLFRSSLWARAGLLIDHGRPSDGQRLSLLHPSIQSKGRGTSAPFELFGAPFIDRLRLLEAVRRLALDGVAFTAISFTPTAGTWAGQLCHGLYAHITDHARFRPFDCAVRLLGLIWDFHGDELEFLPIFERLAGFGRAMITDGRAEEVLHAASSDAEIFSKEKKRYEHYR